MILNLLLLPVLLSVCDVCCMEAHPKLPDIYWNSSNPIFRIDNTDHVIDVNRGNNPFEYDQVNIICPTYSKQVQSEETESYIVYNVSKEEYDSCRITSNPRIIAVCDKPHKIKYFTITFRSFTPMPGGLEFKPGQDYYFISTSTGRSDGLHHKSGGRCSSHHMKVIFKVCCSASDSSDHNAAKSHPLHPSHNSSLPLFIDNNGLDKSKPSALLDKIMGDSSRLDPSSIPSLGRSSSTADRGHPAGQPHALHPLHQAPLRSVNNINSSLTDHLRPNRTLYSTSRSGLLSSPSPSSSSTPASASLVPTSATSYWWRPHFTKLPSLKHNQDLNNARAVDGLQSNSGRFNSHPSKSTSNVWVIIVGSTLGVGLVCIVVCALFACTNYFFFPPRRKQQLPKF